MTTYEFTCSSCGRKVEVRQKMSARLPKTHNGCGGRLRRIWHAPQVAFKGGGFYSTGNR